MHAFSRLLKTDLRNRRNSLFILLATLAIFEILFMVIPTYMAIETKELGTILVLNIIVFIVSFVIPFIHCFTTWSEEWKRPSIYLLLSLPIPRVQIVLSKYLAILIEILLISAVMLTGLSIQNWIWQGGLFKAEPLITLNWSKIVLLVQLILSGSSLMFLCFFSVLISKSFRKFSSLILFIVFFLLLFISRIVLINLPTVQTVVVLCLVFFGGSVYLLEKKIGVE